MEGRDEDHDLTYLHDYDRARTGYFLKRLPVKTEPLRGKNVDVVGVLTRRQTVRRIRSKGGVRNKWLYPGLSVRLRETGKDEEVEKRSKKKNYFFEEVKEKYSD